MNDFPIIDAFICLTGLMLHFSMKWAEYRKDVSPVGLLGYIREVPAQSSVALFASVGAFTVTWSMGWLNPGMALACGYMGNSVADNLATQFAEKPGG